MARKPTGRPIGRPRKPICKTVASAVIDHISNGKSLDEIAALKGMPKPSTVVHWCAKDPEFEALYTRAMRAKAWRYADEVIAIADEECTDAAQVARNRLRADMRRWYVGKILYHVFGDRVEVTTDHSVRITLDTGIPASALDHTPRLTVTDATPGGEGGTHAQ